MRYLLLFCLLFVSSCGDGARTTVPNPDRISVDREARLQPVIRYVEGFIKDHQRLPTQDEFRAGTASMDPMLVLRDRTHTYAASHGAKTENDYMVGIWRVDWYHYYKSWDRSFLNGSDEEF
jgi:hypothetical protein